MLAEAAARPKPLATRIREIVRTEIEPQAVAIDLDGIYPEGALRALGAAGCYRQHLAGLSDGGPIDFVAATEAIAAVAETCLSTAFCVWCQDACAWYIENTGNTALREAFRLPVAHGRVMGGTGLSNPMKAASGIEPLRLTATRAAGGYVLNGNLPYVSNLGDDHPFGIVFAAGGRKVMALASGDLPGVTVAQEVHFCALEGTRTWTTRFRDAFIPESRILADPADEFLTVIRPGFILLQVGMALGAVRDAAAEMRRHGRFHGHVNGGLAIQPDHLEEAAADLGARMARLARTPRETAPDYVNAVKQLRLDGGEWAVRAAHAAMLHAGARGYMRHAPAQRRLRAAYFVAIVTPATKHLRKDLAGAEA